MDEPRRARFEAEALPHLKAVYNHAWRLARHEEDARDLAQETFLRAYQAFDTYQAGTNARAWLLKVLYSVFVNRYRRRRRAPVEVSIDEMELRYPRRFAAPEEPAPRDPWRPASWSAPEVEAALGELPEAFRQTVLLVDVEELSYEEAAAALACPTGTVRSRLFRARRLLAELLEKHAPGRGLASRAKGGGT
jgi:RNA polymerase sigma-70 factor (ECF subfamily)